MAMLSLLPSSGTILSASSTREFRGSTPSLALRFDSFERLHIFRCRYGALLVSGGRLDLPAPDFNGKKSKAFLAHCSTPLVECCLSWRSENPGEAKGLEADTAKPLFGAGLLVLILSLDLVSSESCAGRASRGRRSVKLQRGVMPSGVTLFGFSLWL